VFPPSLGVEQVQDSRLIRRLNGLLATQRRLECQTIDEILPSQIAVKQPAAYRLTVGVQNGAAEAVGTDFYPST
jgi:hypothetical protein